MPAPEVLFFQTCRAVDKLFRFVLAWNVWPRRRKSNAPCVAGAEVPEAPVAACRGFEYLSPGHKRLRLRPNKIAVTRHCTTCRRLSRGEPSMAIPTPGVWGIDVGQCALKAIRL